MPKLAPPSLLLLSLAPAVAATIWGSTYLVTTELLPPSRPLTASAIRTLPAGLLLILFTRSFKPTVPVGRLLTLAIVNIGAFQALLFVAAYRLPGGLAAIVGALQPLIVLLFAWVVDQERPPRIALGATVSGVLGMALLFLSSTAQLDLVGIIAAFAGTISMAAGTFLARRWRNEMPVLGFTGWQLGLGGAMLMPLALWLEPPLPPLSSANGLGYAYLVIVGTLFAYSLWFWGISRLQPVAVSALGLLSPITAIVLGWFALNQQLGGREIAGILLVFASIGIFQLRLPLSPSFRTEPQMSRSEEVLNRPVAH